MHGNKCRYKFLLPLFLISMFMVALSCELIAPVRFEFIAAASPEEGGTITVVPDSADYLAGTKLVAEAVPAENFIFTGWAGSIDTTAIIDSLSNPLTLILINDTRLIATFVDTSTVPVFSLIVEASPPEGGSVDADPDLEAYPAGTEVTLEATPAEGWRFTGWSGALTSSENPLTITINSDTKLAANFEKIIESYTLTTSASPVEGGSVEPSGGTFKEGEEVTVEAIPNAGWRFVEWTGTINSNENPLTFNITQDTDLTAHFERITYELTASALPPEGGSVAPNGGIFNAGEQVTVEAIPNSGWKFIEWTGTINSGENPLTFTITGNTELTAHFVELAKAHSQTITLSDGANSLDLVLGMASGASDNYDSGLDEEAPPTPPEGSFYAHFVIPGYNLFTDFRSVTREKTVWELHFAPQEGRSITLTWNFNPDSFAGTIILTDDPENPSFEINMAETNNYTPAGSINKLFIIQE